MSNKTIKINEEGRIYKGEDLAAVLITQKRASKGITRGGYLCEAGKIRYVVTLQHPKTLRYLKEHPDWFDFKSGSGNNINVNKNPGFWVEREDLQRFLDFINCIRDKINAYEVTNEQVNKFSGLNLQ